MALRLGQFMWMASDRSVSRSTVGFGFSTVGDVHSPTGLAGEGGLQAGESATAPSSASVLRGATHRTATRRSNNANPAQHRVGVGAYAVNCRDGDLAREEILRCVQLRIFQKV